MHNRKILFFLGALAMTTTAFSQEVVGPNTYARFFGGWSFMPSMETTTNSSNQSNFFSTNQTIKFNNGFDLGAATGYKYHPFFRTEISLEYLQNMMSSNSTSSSSNTLASGKVEAWTGMFNNYFDYKNPTFCTPYLGLGLGYMKRHYEVQADPATSANHFDWNMYNLGVQGIAGFSFAVNTAWSVLLDYRYLFSPRQTATITNDTNTVQDSVRINFSSNLLTVGVSYRFG